MPLRPTPTRDSFAMLGALRRQYPAVRACYSRRLQAVRALAGRIVVRVGIDADGAVMTTDVEEDTVRDPDVTACVVTAVAATQFGAHPGAPLTIVRYPMVFAGPARGPAYAPPMPAP